MLTKNNVDAFLLKIKNLIKPYKTITKVDEFPFRELFTKVIVESRDNIMFVVGRKIEYEKIDTNNRWILNGEIHYLVRKTKFVTKHKIIFF